MHWEKNAVLLTILSGLIWGSSFPLMKLGLEYLDPFWFNLLRMVVGNAGMLLVFIIIRRFNRGEFFSKSAVILGVLNGAAFFLQIIGINLTTSTSTVLIVNTNMIFVYLLSYFVLGERLGRFRALSIVMGILGVFLVATEGDIGSLLNSRVIGDFIILMAAIIWAVYMVYIKIAMDRTEDAFSLTGGMLFFTMLFLLPFPFVFHPEVQLGFTGLMIVLYVGIFCTATAYSLWLLSLKHISIITSTILLMIEVAFGIILSAIILNEQLSIWVAGGGALILSAIIITAATERGTQ